MLVLGSIFRCLDAILTIAATMSVKSPFTSPMERREEAARCRQQGFSYGKSDWLTDMKAFDAWQEVMKAKGTRGARSFCEENFLSFTTLTEIASLRRQYADALTDIGFYEPRRRDYYKENSQNVNLVKAVIFGGLNPNLARIRMPDTKYDKVLSGTVEREKEAREIKFYTKDDGEFLFLAMELLSNDIIRKSIPSSIEYPVYKQPLYWFIFDILFKNGNLQGVPTGCNRNSFVRSIILWRTSRHRSSWPRIEGWWMGPVSSLGTYWSACQPVEAVTRCWTGW